MEVVSLGSVDPDTQAGYDIRALECLSNFSLERSKMTSLQYCTLGIVLYRAESLFVTRFL